jgi:Flp pilus assembly protein TadD
MRSLATACALATGLVCCAAVATLAQDSSTLSAEELLSGAPLGGGHDAPILTEEAILALSPEMRAFLDRRVNTRVREAHRLDQLVDALMSSKVFGLSYDEQTRTAAETFAEQAGNCLSFSTMFIVMARHVGLDARFQEVDVPPDWSLREDLFILNRHVNVLVDLGVDGAQVVDFNIDDFKMTYDRQEISDSRAMAHYHNNLGVEAMQADEPALALAYFRQALERTEHRFSPAWTNLGSLYLRTGHRTHAESAFLHALAVDPSDLVAMSNLVRFYDAHGSVERASEYRRRVQTHRMQNPYYRYKLAVQAYTDGDVSDAIGHLKYALRKKRREDTFMFLLGACYLKQGREDRGRRWLKRARAAAESKTARNRYSSKIEALLEAHGQSRTREERGFSARP